MLVAESIHKYIFFKATDIVRLSMLTVIVRIQRSSVLFKLSLGDIVFIGNNNNNV